MEKLILLYTLCWDFDEIAIGERQHIQRKKEFFAGTIWFRLNTFKQGILAEGEESVQLTSLY
jgi:hypothetical protein